ncbi:MAG: hypothetical protein KA314_27950 [Chloroflexi bacterium]|nr:hypothetical protein [Chloroflexota bacterium]MBP8059691.1 hypothetical protein [Chloroflexota bacterium]
MVVVASDGLDYHLLMRWQRFGIILQFLLLFLLLSGLLAPEWPTFTDEGHQLDRLIGLDEFDFLVWEIEAFVAKGNAELAAGHLYLEASARREIVLTYLGKVQEALQVSNEIAVIFADGTIEDPFAAAAAHQAQLATLRTELSTLQPLAESILQEQVASILLDEGFSTLGQVFPPVQARITPLPTLLVVSRRDRIEELYRIPLIPGLTVPERETLEDEIFSQIDRAALIVPLGGIGTYPSMIIETTDLIYLTDVIAHEWAHNWLTLRPLGFNYNADSSMRVINETIASVFGEAIGQKVMARYYPDLLPAPVAAATVNTKPAPQTQPSFDFRAEMATTRIRVDELLAAGLVADAEAYMEERRQLFVANGYLVRKINQAYFAFYGSYADQPGATGGDPTGPMIVALFTQSDSIYQFMQSVAPLTSFSDLEILYEQLIGAEP